MPASPFDAATRAEADDVIIDLRGDINGAAGPVFDAAYDDATALGGGRVLLNFTDVTYINSTGIALIVAVLARARAAGREVVAFGLDEHYREIFQITRLSDYMILLPDESAARGGHSSAAI
jgi:anti-sigma B factor antagonist